MKIICLGKLDYRYNELIGEFIKQIPSLEIVELKDQNDIKKETSLILNKLSSNNYIITLEIEGKQLSSNEFFNIIEKNNEHNVVFIIGSSLGLSSEIKEKANLHLSLSKHTFSHAIARLMIVEQIYRYYMNKKNHPYNK